MVKLVRKGFDGFRGGAIGEQKNRPTPPPEPSGHRVHGEPAHAEAVQEDDGAAPVSRSVSRLLSALRFFFSARVQEAENAPVGRGEKVREEEEIDRQESEHFSKKRREDSDFFIKGMFSQGHAAARLPLLLVPADGVSPEKDQKEDEDLKPREKPDDEHSASLRGECLTPSLAGGEGGGDE